jgi:hypothetical protein
MPEKQIVNELSIWVPLMSALGGGIVTGLFTLIQNIMQKKSEERKYTRMLLFNSAIENWKQVVDLQKINAHKASAAVPVLPIDSYLVHMALLFKTMETIGTDPEEIIAELKKVRTTMKKVNDDIFKDSPNPFSNA